MNKKINLVYFSPGGTTKEVAEIFASNLVAEINHIDLLKNRLDNEMCFTQDEVLVAVMPVFAGRIPSVFPDMLKKLKGNKTPAIVIVVYGNREFDDAMLELSDSLKKNDFNIIGAAAFIARHSIFPEVAKDRPDNNDIKIINEFAQKCIHKISNNDINEPLNISGNKPYKKVSSMPITPATKKKTCTNCGICANICPVNAIDKDKPTQTDATKCITCMACVYHCPTKSRTLNSIVYKIAKGKFEKNYSARKEPIVIL